MHALSWARVWASHGPLPAQNPWTTERVGLCCCLHPTTARDETLEGSQICGECQHVRTRLQHFSPPQPSSCLASQPVKYCPRNHLELYVACGAKAGGGSAWILDQLPSLPLYLSRNSGDRGNSTHIIANSSTDTSSANADLTLCICLYYLSYIHPLVLDRTASDVGISHICLHPDFIPIALNSVQTWARTRL